MIDTYRHRELTVELRTQIQQTGGDELDEFYTSQAEEQFETHLGSYIREKSIPDAIVQPTRDKAIEQMVAILRGQYAKYTAAAPAGNPS